MDFGIDLDGANGYERGKKRSKGKENSRKRQRQCASSTDDTAAKHHNKQDVLATKIQNQRGAK